MQGFLGRYFSSFHFDTRTGALTDTPTQKITLSENQVEALTYIEQCYFLHGTLPTNEQLSDVIGVTVQTIKNWWKNDSFQLVLRNKGLPVGGETQSKKEVLTPEQLAVANKVLNLQDRRSLREKLEEAGVTPQKYQVWRRDPTFNEYMRKRAESLFSGGSDAEYLYLMKNVEGGSLEAAKLYFEMTGIYNPKISLELNVDRVMVGVIEIIQRRVKDPAILEAIASDIEALVSGRPTGLDAQDALPAVIEAREVSETSSAPVFQL
jgi:hypothetical protein